MGQGQTELGIVNIWLPTDTLTESVTSSRQINVSRASEIIIWGQSAAANPGESRIRLLTGFAAGSFTELLVLDDFDGIALATNFDQGDAFVLEFLMRGSQNRKLGRYDASAGAGTKWTILNETTNVEYPWEFIQVEISTDSNVGSYAHTVQALIRS